MICYRDMTFCTFAVDCKHKWECPRVLTDEVRREAEEWWGNENAPIMQHMEKPECWEEE